MMSTLRTALLGAALAGLMASCTATPDPGDTEYNPLSGELVSVEVAPFSKVCRATKIAMQNLMMRPMETDRDAFTARFLGEGTFGAVGQSHEIRVRVDRLNETDTRVTMRIVGRRSENHLTVLLSEIRKAAGTTPKKNPQPAG